MNRFYLYLNITYRNYIVILTLNEGEKMNFLIILILIMCGVAVHIIQLKCDCWPYWPAVALVVFVSWHVVTTLWAYSFLIMHFS